MRLLDPTYIRNIVDYSFGDESGKELPDGYMRVANSANEEFLAKYRECRDSDRPFMTLFIDNMRLYRRSPITYTSMEVMNPMWKGFRDQKLAACASEDLLALCGSLPDMDLIIFTGFEDVPTDDFIFDAIPENVLAVYASNAEAFGGKVHPIPYGLQRILGPTDTRQSIILGRLGQQAVQPSNLLYINHRVANHSSRQAINDHYRQFPWVTIKEPISIAPEHYNRYLDDICAHRFVLCPAGNAPASECHRDWEVLYMRRVPVVVDNAYHRAIFQDIPVLYVQDILGVTKELLQENDYLYQQIQEFDMSRLDIENIYNHCIEQVNTLIAI